MRARGSGRGTFTLSPAQMEEIQLVGHFANVGENQGSRCNKASHFSETNAHVSLRGRCTQLSEKSAYLMLLKDRSPEGREGTRYEHLPHRQKLDAYVGCRARISSIEKLNLPGIVYSEHPSDTHTWGVPNSWSPPSPSLSTDHFVEVSHIITTMFR